MKEPVGSAQHHALKPVQTVHRSPHPGGPLLDCWKAGLLTSGFSCRCRRSYSRHLPAYLAKQWCVAAFVRVTVAGAMPASHRLPSPTNNDLNLTEPLFSVK